MTAFNLPSKDGRYLLLIASSPAAAFASAPAAPISPNHQKAFALAK